MQVTSTLHRAHQHAPNRIATQFGDRASTYAETRERVSRIASGLISRGFGSDERGAILALNSDHYADLFYAVPWAGGVVVPLNVRWNVHEVAYALNDCGAAVLFVDENYVSDVDLIRELCPGVHTFVLMGDGPAPKGVFALSELTDDHDPIEDAGRSGDDLFGIFYTGGTTGSPKGVMLSHRNIMTAALGGIADEFLTKGGTYLHAAPMFHIADITAWLAESVIGGTHVILPAFDPSGVLEVASRHRVTDALLVPTMLQAVVSHPDFAKYDLGTLKRIVYGAAPISESLLARVRGALPQVEFLQAFGMTEVAIATILRPHEHEAGRLRSAGRAAAHCEVRIVDPETGTELAQGEVGEIVIRGDNVTQGYWNMPELTADTIRDGWLHSGDGGHMDVEGFIYITDRLKDMIISGGENVYSAEVENVVSEHPAVQMCAVVGASDDKWGERVHAVVVLKEGRELEIEELREFCTRTLARYKSPRSMEVVEQLPVSAAGKILKRVLRGDHAGTA